jgi:8-oxo-dGTP pyrophosphatase MutT (NUDIX family)
VSSASRSRAEVARRLRGALLDAEEAARLDVHGRIDAAVLVPLYLDGPALHAVFTRRRDDLRRHGGEISFPGGRQDEPDEDLRETALRESEEEIGLPRSAVTLQGALPPVGTFVTGYRIFPFVATIERPAQLFPAEAEVARILEFTLRELADGHEMKRLVRRGVPIKTPTYTVGRHLIWGATARMVEQQLDRQRHLR